jgi:hypothetical protein
MEPRVPVVLPQQKQQKAGQSVRAPNVNNLSLDKLFKVVVTVVRQIMTESNGALLEVAKILAITKNCFKSHGTKWTIEFIGPSKSYHLIRMAL